MPIYVVTLQKEFANQGVEQPWVNTYHVSAASEEDALDIGEQIQVIEAAVHWSNINFTRITARQDSPLAGSGRQRATSLLGARDATGESFLPSFNTIRVTFTDGVNRPDQKYLRPMINENEQSGGTLEGDMPGFMEASYVNAILALTGVVSSDGVPYTSGAVYPFVQMRQRSWHRRTRPGFHRGYVPNT